MAKDGNERRLFGRAIRSRLEEHKESKAKASEIVKRRQMEARTASVLREIYDFLEVDDIEGNYRDLKIAMRNSMVAWIRLQKTRARFQPADVVLSEVYREGKLLSQLKRLEEFVSDLDDIEDADLIRNMGYAGHIFFLKNTMLEMRRKYKEAVESVKPPEIDVTRESVCWFIKSECGNIPALREIPKARENASYLLNQMKQEHELDKQDQKLYSAVIEAGFFLEHWDDTAVLELEELEQSYDERRRKIENETKKGTELYRILDGLFTEEWFAKIDPKQNVKFAAISAEEVKAVYRAVLREIQETAIWAEQGIMH